MAEIEEGLVALLAGDGTIAGMVTADGEARIGPERPEQGAALPAISYTRIDTPRAMTHDNAGGGGTVTTRARIQLEAWAGTYAEAVALARAIISLLMGWRGTLGSYRVDRTEISNEGDGPEPGANLKRRMLDVRLTYEEAI